MTRILVGSYGPPTGSSGGMTLLSHQHDATEFEDHGIVAEGNSLSFLTSTPDHSRIYGVSEGPSGAVVAYRWTDESDLEQISFQPTEGADPCHVLVHPSGRFILTSNYTSGRVSVHPLESDGTIGHIVDHLDPVGSGPNPDRQQSSHPHMTAALSGGSQIAIPDLGADRVWIADFDVDTGKLRLRSTYVSTPPGSGPRQIIFSTDEKFAHILCELDGSLISMSWPPTASVESRRIVAADKALTKDNQAGTLTWAKRDEVLFASHRGADTITTIATRDGSAAVLRDDPSQGRWPRHISVSGQNLYVANQESDSVSLIRLSGPDMSFQVQASARVTSPSCVLVLP